VPQRQGDGRVGPGRSHRAAPIEASPTTAVGQWAQRSPHAAGEGPRPIKAAEESRHDPLPTSTSCLVPSGSSFGTAAQAHLYPGQEMMFIQFRIIYFPSTHNGSVFSTADDLARKQTPLKQEPSKALLGSVRHPWVWAVPPPLSIPKGPSSQGCVTSTPGSPTTSQPPHHLLSMAWCH